MFGIGMPELILILVVALIVIGPKKLPDLAKSLGRALGEFKKASRELKESIEIDHDFSDIKKAFDEIKSDVKETVDVETRYAETKQSDLTGTEKESKENETAQEEPKGSVDDS